MSDHWLQVFWTKASGWSKPVITPYCKISLEPSALVFHYALACFEGMKAYKDANKNIRLFRPDENAKRMNTTAKRLCMPQFAGEEFVECLKALVREDKDWIPDQKGYSLYIRPTMIATEPLIGVHPPTQVMLYVITSPVGPYYTTGFKPVSLFADSANVRAWPGGMGNFKAAGNYAPTILPAEEAQTKGYQQVLWLVDDHISEVGTMNLFCFWINEEGQKELITAPLDGTILPGVTRKSIIEMCRDWKDFAVSEKPFTMTQIVKALSENRVLEMFGSGTAAVVSPVNKINYKGVDYQIPCKNNTAGDLAQKLMHDLQAIQYGEVKSPWSVIV